MPIIKCEIIKYLQYTFQRKEKLSITTSGGWKVEFQKIELFAFFESPLFQNIKKFRSSEKEDFRSFPITTNEANSQWKKSQMRLKIYASLLVCRYYQQCRCLYTFIDFLINIVQASMTNSLLVLVCFSFKL